MKATLPGKDKLSQRTLRQQQMEFERTLFPHDDAVTDTLHKWSKHKYKLLFLHRLSALDHQRRKSNLPQTNHPTVDSLIVKQTSSKFVVSQPALHLKSILQAMSDISTGDNAV